MPWPTVNVVTMISSKLSANASRQPASSEERSIGSVTLQERPERAGAEVHRRLLEVAAEPAQPRDRVVEHRDDAERRVRHDQREDAQLDADHGGEEVGQRDAGHDAGQRDRQDDQQRDRCRGRRSGTAAAPGRPCVPSTSATSVATMATCTETQTASRAPWECQAACHHSVVKPGGGHANVREVLNELITTSASGDVDEHQREPAMQTSEHAAQESARAVTGSPARRCDGRRPGRRA